MSQKLGQSRVEVEAIVQKNAGMFEKIMRLRSEVAAHAEDYRLLKGEEAKLKRQLFEKDFFFQEVEGCIHGTQAHHRFEARRGRYLDALAAPVRTGGAAAAEGSASARGGLVPLLLRKLMQLDQDREEGLNRTTSGNRQHQFDPPFSTTVVCKTGQ